MIERALYTVCALMLIVCACALATPAQAIEWKDLWSTQVQRSQRQLDKQDFETLIEQAPNSEWRGLGEYAKGDYAKAASSFAQEREVAEQAGEIEDRIRATYNQATALIQDAKYQEAMSLYDEILATEPEHNNALHNRDIVQQLIEQQEQESEQGDSEEQQDGEPSDEESSEGEGGEEGEEGEDGEEGEEGEEGEQSSEQENGEPSDEQSNDNENDGVSDFEESDQAQSPEQSDEEAAEAAQAMQAEQERELTDAEAQAVQNAQTGVDSAPLTEREQTNEQLLRQIPDDPVGLLERKIQNRHLTDFPKVEDSDQPW